MAGPITWRSVGGGGGRSAPSFLNMGQNQIQQGLATLAGLVKDNQKADDQNFLQVRENNTEKYLDAVQSAGGIEALQNPEIRAQLEAQRAGFGAAIDRNATRNAIDTQVTGLQRAASVSNAYQDQTTERNQRGLIDNLYQLAAAGDKAGAQKILDEHELFDEGNIRKNITGTFDAATNRQYAAEDQARQGRNEQRSIAQFQETMANARENRTDRQLARQERRDANYLTAMDEQLKLQEASIRSSNPLANTSKDPITDANAAVAKVAESIAPWASDNSSARNKLTDRITSYLSDGFDIKGAGKVKLPKAVIDQYLTEASDKSFLNTDSLLADMDTWVKNYATINAGAFTKAAETGKALQGINSLQKSVSENRIRLLKGEKLDSTDFSDRLATTRKKAPGLNLLPSQDADGPASERTLDASSYRPDGTRWGDWNN